jgi:hypothetical protein
LDPVFISKVTIVGYQSMDHLLSQTETCNITDMKLWVVHQFRSHRLEFKLRHHDIHPTDRVLVSGSMYFLSDWFTNTKYRSLGVQQDHHFHGRLRSDCPAGFHIIQSGYVTWHHRI